MNNTLDQQPRSIQQLLIEARDRLQQTSDSARLDAEVLLAHALKRDRSYLYTWPDRELAAASAAEFLSYVERRQRGVPVAYITGVKEFWSMNFCVNTHTLVPRADTETLVQLAIEKLASSPGPVLDLGTGCGAIAISIAKECEQYPKADSTHRCIEVSASDNSPNALQVARENAQRHNANVSFYLSDWFVELPQQRWQLIVSNPPYLADDDCHLASLVHEPRKALVAPDDGLGDIAKIIATAKYYLGPSGTLMIEHGDRQGLSVRTLMLDAGYYCVRTETDIAERDRVTLGQLNEY